MEKKVYLSLPNIGESGQIPGQERPKPLRDIQGSECGGGGGGGEKDVGVDVDCNASGAMKKSHSACFGCGFLDQTEGRRDQ